VVSNQQTLHFRQLRAILERLGHPVAPKITHVAFGYVPGMSTRGGENISLANFLAEAKSRAAEAYEQVRRAEDDDSELDEITEKVAIGSSFFYFLNHSNNKDFQFSWKEALNFQGDTGPYVQYAVARINSIFEKAAIAPVFAAEHLTDDASFEMLQLISEMDDAAEAACADYEPLHLATNVLALARAFMKGYQSLRVVGAEPEVAAARLALFGRVREALEHGMTMLGVPVIRRM
jgi:arginyl-tRNA synthetase